MKIMSGGSEMRARVRRLAVSIPIFTQSLMATKAFGVALASNEVYGALARRFVCEPDDVDSRAGWLKCLIGMIATSGEFTITKMIQDICNETVFVFIFGYVVAR